MRALPRPERRGRHPHCRPGEGLELQLEPHPDEQEQGADIDDPIDGVGRFHAEGVQDEPWDQKPPERGELHGRGNNDQGRATSSRGGDDRRGIVTARPSLADNVPVTGAVVSNRPRMSLVVVGRAISKQVRDATHHSLHPRIAVLLWWWLGRSRE